MTKVEQKLIEVIPFLLGEYSLAKNCCIAATNIGIRALKEFGIEASPLSVKTIVANKTAMDLINQGKHIEEDENSKMVGIGFGNPLPNCWPGHLVIYSENGFPHILDLSLDQASRTDKGIKLSPVSLIVPEGFNRTGMKTSYDGGGIGLFYESYPNDFSFKESNDWKFSYRHDNLVKKLIKILKSNNL